MKVATICKVCVAGLKVLWILLCVGLGILAVIRYDTGANRDAGIALLLGMLILCFPSSVLAYFGLAAVNFYFADEKDYGRPQLIADWVVFFSFGVIQWFWLVPKVWNRLMKVKESS